MPAAHASREDLGKDAPRANFPEPSLWGVWALVLIAWCFGVFTRLYWIEESKLPEKQADYHWQGELLPNTHDSYFFGAIIQKAHLGVHQQNKEIPDAYKYGPITLFSAKVLDVYNAPVYRRLRLSQAQLDTAAQALEAQSQASHDTSNATMAAMQALRDARKALAGPFLVPKMLRDTARASAETARQVAQRISDGNGTASSPHLAAATAALVRAEDSAVAASRRSMLSVEQIMVYSPALVGSLLVVPLVLIGRLYQLTLWGFLAALMAVSANSYYNRTMAGYFDTDMFSVPIPAAILYWLLRAVRLGSLGSAITGALLIMAYPFFYRSSMPIAAAMGLAFIGHQAVFRFRDTTAWQTIAPVAMAVLFVDAAFPFMDATGSRTGPALIWLAKILALVGSALLMRRLTAPPIPEAGATAAPSSLPRLRWAAALALVLVVLFSSPFSLVTQKILQYLPSSERTSVVETAQNLQFKNVISTIQEAREIPGREVGLRIAGTVVGCIIALFGYALLAGRHPEFLLAAPLVGIGVFTLWGGLRFTIPAVAIAGLSFAYPFFWRSDSPLARAAMRTALFAALGAIAWSWLVNFTGAPVPWFFLPLAALAGWGIAHAADEEEVKWHSALAGVAAIGMVLLGCLIRSEYETRYSGIWSDRYGALARPLYSVAVLSAALAAITATLTRGTAAASTLVALRVALGVMALTWFVGAAITFRSLAGELFTGVGWEDLPTWLVGLQWAQVILAGAVAGWAVHFTSLVHSRAQRLQWGAIAGAVAALGCGLGLSGFNVSVYWANSQWLPVCAAILLSAALCARLGGMHLLPSRIGQLRPAAPAMAACAAALAAGVAWALLAQALNEPLPHDALSFRPLPEPLSFGPWAIGLVAGIAATYTAKEAAAGPRGWIAAVSALLGLIAGVLVMGRYLDASAGEIFSLGDAAPAPRHAPWPLALMAIMAATTAGVLPGLLRGAAHSIVTACAVACASVLCFLTPNLLHARDQSRGIPPVLEQPSVEILDVLRAHAKPGDFVLTWWDYGGATWYHAGCNVLCHPGNQTEDIYVLARAFSATNKLEVANLGRLAVEAYAQKGPLAVHQLFKGELGPGEDGDHDLRDDWSGLPATAQVGPRGIIRALNSTNYRPPLPTRDIYFYLPKKLLPILQVMRQFSERDLWPLQREFQTGLNFQTGVGAPGGKPDPAVAIDWFTVAAEKGHAEAQFRLAGLLRDEYLKTLPPPVAARVNESLKKGEAGREELAALHRGQQQRGQAAGIESAFRWAARAASAGPAAFSRPAIGSTGDAFAAQDPDRLLALAVALRDQIGQLLPVDLASALRSQAEQFVPRDAELPIPTFFPTTIRVTQSMPAQTEAIFLADRYLLDRADLRMYESMRDQGFEPARVEHGIGLIRRLMARMSRAEGAANTEAIAQQAGEALRMIHPQIALTPQLLAAPLQRRDPAAFGDFALQALRHWFPGADKQLGAQLLDGRVVIGAVEEITLEHITLVGEKVVPGPSPKPGEVARQSVPVTIPWRMIHTLYRPSTWLNQLFITSLGPAPAKLPSGTTVEGELLRRRQIGLTPGSQASDLFLVIANDLNVAYLMHRDVFHSNIVQMLLMGVYDDQRFELIFHNREGKLIRFRRSTP